MKTIKYLALAVLSFTLVNCSTDDKGEREYGGSANVNFLNQGQAKSVFVVAETGFTDAVIEIGTLKEVSGTHTVTLVPDVANSTAVEGVDYVITTPTDELTSGESTGSFTVRFLESAATQAGKSVVFRLESATLSNAAFNNVQVVNVSLTCPIETFVGQFQIDSAWNGNGQSYEIVDEGNNTLKIVDFWSAGNGNPDFFVTYDPNTFVVTIPVQSVGEFYQGIHEIFVRPATGGTLISTLNPCTRVLNLNVNYYMPSANLQYGNYVELFNGVN